MNIAISNHYIEKHINKIKYIANVLLNTNTINNIVNVKLFITYKQISNYYTKKT